MLRKIMLPLVAAFALTGCLSATGPADYSVNQDPEGELVLEEHTGRGFAEQPGDGGLEGDIN